MGVRVAVSKYSSGVPRGLTGYAVCPGSCGELVQGTWGGVNFLVPCPVKLYSRASITLIPGVPLTSPSPARQKALQAVARTLQALGYGHLGGELVVDSAIPWGKGMASSTADIGASIAAAADALKVRLDPAMLLRLALTIEPTDGTLLPGITLLDHIRGRWTLALGQGIPAGILILDLGGQVDTAQFNARPDLAQKNLQNEKLTRQAYYLVRTGLQSRDLNLLGRGATLSAQANQSILAKAGLEEIIAFAGARGAAGVIAAHSGTVLGLIYDRTRNLGLEEKLVNKAFPQIKQYWRTELTSGGVEVVNQDGSPRRGFTGGYAQVWP